jgi:hypothetical protein
VHNPCFYSNINVTLESLYSTVTFLLGEVLVAKKSGINTRSFGRTKKKSFQNEQRFQKHEVLVRKPKVSVRKPEISVRNPEVSGKIFEHETSVMLR